MSCVRILTISAILVGTCLGNPVPSLEEPEGSLSVPASASSEPKDAAAEGSKPRCLQTLLGYYAKKKITGAVESFTNPGSGMADLPSPPGSLQGGMLAGPSFDAPGVGGGGSGFGGGGQGVGGLPNHAMDAVNKAQLMNSQLNGMNSQLHSQFGGGGGGGDAFRGPAGPSIPFSPQITFRHGMTGFSTGIYEGQGSPYSPSSSSSYPQGYLNFM